jgi:hypothetical protein
MKALGHSIGAIAQAIGRPKSTVSRPENALASRPPFQAILKEIGKGVQIRFS